jgi:hypothetical protein
VKATEFIIEGVAGAKKCWPGHRKVGTQPGTGKNAGKPVNKCKKIGEDDLDESVEKASALEKFRKGAAEREKKHDTAEKEIKARHARGEEDMKGSIDRLEKHINTKESVEEAAKKGLYYYVNKRKKAGTSRDASSPKAPTAQAWKDAAKTAKKEDLELEQEFDMIESIIEEIADRHAIDAELVWEDLSDLSDDELYVFAVTQPVNEDWQKANKRDKTDGMSKKAVNAYRRENPGSKLKTAVTTKPSKLKKGSKASKRRKSYCSRSRGQMKMHSISCAKTPDKAICKARRRWNC